MEHNNKYIVRYHRSEPVNYQEKDTNLFAHDLEFKTNDPTYCVLKNRFINDEMLVFSRFGFEPNSFLYREHYKPATWNTIKFLLINTTKRHKTIHKAIWVTDAWSSGYFHWFGDVLQKLFLLKKEIELGNYTLILPSSFKAVDFVNSTLDLLNVKVHFIERQEVIYCKELVTYQEFPISGNYYDPVMKEMADFFRKCSINPVNEQNIEFVYISRRKAIRRKVINEEEVTDLFVKYGFSIVYMEDLTWEEQVALLKNTKVLASMHGAGLTNMLFIPSGAGILEFRHPHSEKQNCFFSLSSALDHEYYYAIGQSENPDAHEGDLTMDLAELEKLIIRIVQKSKDVSE